MKSEFPPRIFLHLVFAFNPAQWMKRASFVSPLHRFRGDQECYYEDDLRILSSLSKREHMRGNETLLDFRTSKFVLRISRDSYQLLKRHLQERQNNQIWNIIQEHLYIDIFDGMPRSKSQIDAMSGSLAGEAKREANKAKVGFTHLFFFPLSPQQRFPTIAEFTARSCFILIQSGLLRTAEGTRN